MKRLSLTILLLGLLSAAAFGQAARFDSTAQTTTTVSATNTTVLVPLPGAIVTVCSYPSNGTLPCTNKASVCPDATLVGCTSSAPNNPITADSLGNFGFWAPGGSYDYTVCAASGVCQGPYHAVLGQPNGTNGMFVVDGISYTTIQSAVAAAGTTGSVLIPSAYAGTDSFTNPTNRPILDFRSAYGEDAYRGFHSVKDFGAKGDGQVYIDGAMTASSAILTSNTATFTAADVGKPISIFGAGAASTSLDTTIAGFTDSHHVTLTVAASSTVSSKYFAYGTDDTTAINTAITYIWGGVTFTKNVRGGNLWFPKGTYITTSAVLANSSTGQVGVHLVGPGSESVGQGAVGAAQILYVGGGSGRVIDARSSYGFHLDGVSARYASSNFAGVVVEFRHDTSGVDAAYGVIRNNIIGGVEGLNSAAYCVSLLQAIIIHIDHNHIQFCAVGVTGTQGASSYSNANAITYNTFDNLNDSAITDAGGQTWTVDHNIFEGPRFGAGIGLHYVYRDTVNTGAPSLQFANNWVGDCSPDVAANWMIFQKQVGLVVRDNFFGSCGTGAQLLFSASWANIAIQGNVFAETSGQPAIDLGNFAGQSNGGIITGNTFASTTVDPVTTTFNGFSNLFVAGNNTAGSPPQQRELTDQPFYLWNNLVIGQNLTATDCAAAGTPRGVICLGTITTPTGNPASGKVVIYNSGTQVSVRDSNGNIDVIAAPSNSASLNGLTLRSNPVSPSAAGGTTAGSNALPFSSVYIGNAATNNIQVTGTAASAKVATMPDNTGTVGELNLAQSWTALQTFTSGIKAGASGSTISDSRTLVQAVFECGTTTTCANTANNSDWIIHGNVALASASPSTATVASISPAFTSTATYNCTAVPEGATATIAAAGVALTKVSGSSFTLTGPATVTTVIDYICIGH